MGLSARIIGKMFNLTAEEMNRVLLKLGYLEGSPGNYIPTDKASDFVTETDFHRGTGGYDWYNRYWTTRTYDDTILDQLNREITPELCQEAREEVAALRVARYAAQAAERAASDKEFLAEQAAKKTVKTAESASKSVNTNFLGLSADAERKLGIGLLILLGCACAGAAGFGIYKIVTKERVRRKRKKGQEQDDTRENDEKK